MAYAALVGEGIKEAEEIIKKGVKRVASFFRESSSD
jgi:hypothetical protein